MQLEPFRSITEAEQFLYNSLPVFHRQGPAAYKADIGNISALMDAAGNPHQAINGLIHIAGTNGKGSTTHLISAYLQQYGYKTGVYTSPHYTDIRERIKINGQLIPEESFVGCLNRLLPAIEAIQPSFFEIICAMAFLYFKEEEVDFAIIETGMGGRLDSTNIIQPILSVITNISFDHQQFLGDTLEKIAFEKAGIIKQKTPVIIGEKIPQTEDVFISGAQEKNAPISFAQDRWRCSYLDSDGINTFYKVEDLVNLKSIELSTGLHGIYQAQNIQVFLDVCHHLAYYYGIPFDWSKVREAVSGIIALTRFIGRWQIVSKEPLLILESAHNIAGIDAAVRQLEKINYDSLYIIFGTVADKDVDPVLAILPAHASYIWTRANIPRAMDEGILGQKASERGLSGITAGNVSSAMEYALSHAGKNDLILITGSIFVVGDAISFLQNRGNGLPVS